MVVSRGDAIDGVELWDVYNMLFSRGDAFNGVGCEIHIKERHGGKSGRCYRWCGDVRYIKRERHAVQLERCYRCCGCVRSIK